jgi:hypothetical protein
VLGRYRHLEDVPEDPESWEVAVRSAAKLAVTLADERDHALLFRDLATLRTDAPVGTVDEWRWPGPTDAFPKWAERLRVGGLADRARRLAERRDHG